MWIRKFRAFYKIFVDEGQEVKGTPLFQLDWHFK